MTHERMIETELPTKADMLEAITTARRALREAERALRANDFDSMALWAEEAAGAASVVWSDAELHWNAAR